MAKGLDGLPDLWGLIRQLLRWKNVFKKQQPLIAPTPKQETITEEKFSTSPYTQRGWTEQNRARSAHAPQAQPQLKRLNTLHSRLRDRQFLRQALVVNEILNKPLALRRGRQRH